MKHTLINIFTLKRNNGFYKSNTGAYKSITGIIITILGFVFTDLLTGLVIGLAFAAFFILFNNYLIPYKLTEENIEGKIKIKIELAQEVTFLNKASILKPLAQIPFGSTVEIDASKTYYMEHDVLEIIENFKVSAKQREINLTITELYAHKEIVPPNHMTIKTIENGKRHKINEISKHFKMARM